MAIDPDDSFTTAPSERAERREVWALVLLAVVVRLIHLWFISATPVFQYHRSFVESDMYIFDQWARQIVGGDVLGFHTPHHLSHWQLEMAPKEKWEEWYGHASVFYKAPFYAYLIACLYRLFGDPMLPLALLQIAVAAASLMLLVRIGERLVGPMAGRLGGLLFALYGPAIHFDVLMLRGPWIQLAALAVTWSLVRLRERPVPAVAAVVGGTVGIALVVNEGFLMLPVLVGLLVVWWVRERRLLRLAAAFAAGLLAALSPVVARNVIVGAPPFKLAVTGGTVYAVFNAAQSSPYFFKIHPTVIVPILEESGGTLSGTIAACLRTFPGPLAVLRFYAHKGLGLVIPYENPDNVNYYYAQLKDPMLNALPAYGILFPLVIVGLVAHGRRLRTLEPLLPAFLAILLSILLTQALSRYRVTLAVSLFPIAGLALARMVDWAKAGRLRHLAAAVLGIATLTALASVAQAKVVFRGLPASYFQYRKSEFELGADFYARQGRYAEASGEIAALVARNPERTTRVAALLALASMEVRRGDRETARAALEAAQRVGASDPGVLIQAGDLYRDELQDRAAALASYRRAEAVASAMEEVRIIVNERVRNLEAAPQPR